MAVAVERSNESESTPTLTFVPSTPNANRAWSALSWLSPSEIVGEHVAGVTAVATAERAGALCPTRGASTSCTNRTPGAWASAWSRAGLTQPVITA